ncbi:hypothetical protein N7G274_000026 [Stereocaulon virgatum]|uniref:Uncharacterized protein n=1 Tax=Stereocaulon virgatum TaxID=373712 RepID=A0ABR4ARM2_9LECA
MNLSATLNIFKLLVKPSLCVPHATISTFEGLSIGLPAVLQKANGNRPPDIQAVVFDKDNCFAKPNDNEIHEQYKHLFEEIRNAFSSPRLLIVSNSAGSSEDPDGKEADLLEQVTGVKVFRHSTKKPGCAIDVYKHLRSIKPVGVTHAAQVAVVGDRLFTDVMMANMMGAWSIWIKDGVVKNDDFLSRVEKGLPSRLKRYGILAPAVEQKEAKEGNTEVRPSKEDTAE